VVVTTFVIVLAGAVTTAVAPGSLMVLALPPAVVTRVLVITWLTVLSSPDMVWVL